MSAKASGAQAHSGDAKNRGHGHHDGSAGRAFTVEQKAAVIRIKRCSPTAFYEILGLEEVKTSCSDSDIKKAYRKQSLLTHPDKNGYEGADEAFKLVSRAFQVLSDPDKKAKFDRFGGDPDARFQPGPSTNAGASPFSGFGGMNAGAQRGNMWEGEMTPEDLFRQFFGGGGGGGFGGGPFGGGLFDGGGPGFVFNMGGGPGVRVHQFGGGRPRRRPGTAQPPGTEPAPSLSASLTSLLPLLFLFILPLLSSFFGGSTGSQGPSVVFEGPRTPYTQIRTSHNLKVPYYVNPVEVEDYNNRNWRKLDEVAEGRYIHQVRSKCENEHLEQRRQMEEAQGWFFVDDEKMSKARKMKMPNCETYRKLGGR